MPKQRLDTLLTERGLLPTRSRAAASVMAGQVRVGPDRRRASKPSEMVDSAVQLDVDRPPPYVSRGGIKLANALDAAGLDPAGRDTLDVGASTGGFSDCLLQRGAARVTAVDVGYGLLDLRLREDPRVTVLERVNARHLEPAQLPYAPELITLDVSFISLTRVLPAVLACATERFDALAMIKPQFEVGRARVGKGGVVRDVAARRDALVAVSESVLGRGYSVLGLYTSGLPGPKGNRETFVQVAEAGRSGPPDLQALAREVEP
ncbi:MAG TPA: TlyA family RNA methyltransferase [Solirubrobacteraceae bacterium]|jgi:23S rRNA (cytidine1920-2'-O)/16S rRNA (cytidine1409-2'-O)-methyltransferase|nr:TlyA family RNA methyltransferase [Solirubrobacteraceae bacterium]